MSKHALVYGGAGALGRTIVAHFRGLNWKVTSIDRRENPDATHSITLRDEEAGATWDKHAKTVASAVKPLGGVDALICVAGGWCGGNAAAEDFVSAVETSMNQSVQTSAIAAHLAASHLNRDGLLVLTGAHAALAPTPGMIAYGMTKAAVHHLVASLGAPESGLPEGARAVGILPITLDTPMNRKFMPHADTSKWTPLDAVAAQIGKWAKHEDKAKSGALYSLITVDGQTEFKVAN
ncbi:hypothetical protein H9P43_009209 [Blastocladiella emersonii ATCC 22665]|nr:hypothetical protein H9P43_009209 [Blastocladiella emersonii ATCC 22665]